MKGYRIARALKLLLFGAVAVWVFGELVMGLWNWLMPAVFGSRVITFWQALGLLVLSRILFGRLGGPGRRMYWRHRMAERWNQRMHWRHRMAERWNQMTPEEREKFTEGMKAAAADSSRG